MITSFELKRPTAQYRLEKGKPPVISNDLMSDGLAIEFLKINPARIELFATFPDNWKELIGLEQEPKAPIIPAPEKKSELKSEKCCEKEEDEPCDDCRRAALLKIRQPELKQMYPDVKLEFGMNKTQYVNKIIDWEKANK